MPLAAAGTAGWRHADVDANATVAGGGGRRVPGRGAAGSPPRTISRLFARRQAARRTGARETERESARGERRRSSPRPRASRVIRKHPPSLATTGEDMRTYVRRSHERYPRPRMGRMDGYERAKAGRSVDAEARGAVARRTTWRDRVVTTRRPPRRRSVTRGPPPREYARTGRVEASSRA